MDDAAAALLPLLHGMTMTEGTEEAEAEAAEEEEEDGEYGAGQRISAEELRMDVAMEWHSHALERFGSMELMVWESRSRSRSSDCSSSSSCCPSPCVPLKSLRAIALRELRQGRVHRGRVVVGKVCAEALVIRGVMSVLQDAAFPSMAVRIAIYNTAAASHHGHGLLRLLSKGSTIAVKEPFLKRARDGLLVLRVDNPANIDVPPYISSSPPPPPPPPHRTTTIAATATDDARLLRRMGNRLFQMQDWLGAIHCYTSCISALQQQLLSSCCTSTTIDRPIGEPFEPQAVQRRRRNSTAPSTPQRNLKSERSHSVNDPSAAFEMLLVALSNRAEAWMKLDKYKQALKDSEAALRIDPSHVSSLVRKGRALHGLQQLLTNNKAGHSFQPLESVEHDASNEKKTCPSPATITLAGYSDFLLGRAPPPKLPDYIGPVVIRKSCAGGRGLFATCDVPRGSLLLVSNAIAMSPEHSLDRNGSRGYVGVSHEGLVAKLISLAMSSHRFLRLLYTLCSSSSSALNMPVPSMDIFASTAQEDSSSAPVVEIDVSRIRGIVRHNSFVTSMMGGTCIARNTTGLWLVPAFINHSCIPKAAWTVVEEAMVIHAATDICAGQEITMPYFDTLVPLKLREKCCSNWDFICECDRCLVEKSVEGTMGNMVRRFRYLYDQAADEYMSLLSSDRRSEEHTTETSAVLPACSMLSELFALIKEQVERLGGLSAVERKWVLGSFSHAFVANYFVTWKEHGVGTAMYRRAKEVLEAGRECEAGSVITVNLAARLYESNLRRRRRREEGGVVEEEEEGEWREDCIAHFGEHGVVGKLLRRLANSIPAF